MNPMRPPTTNPGKQSTSSARSVRHHARSG
jgi:hypothetical protein